MKATVIQKFMGVRDGMVYPEPFKPGDVVEGALAKTAIQGGWAETEDLEAAEAAAAELAKVNDERAESQALADAVRAEQKAAEEAAEAKPAKKK
jgi:hypothetical protein